MPWIPATTTSLGAVLCAVAASTGDDAVLWLPASLSLAAFGVGAWVQGLRQRRRSRPQPGESGALDANALKTALQRALDAEARARMLVDSLPDLVFEVNADHSLADVKARVSPTKAETLDLKSHLSLDTVLPLHVVPLAKAAVDDVLAKGEVLRLAYESDVDGEHHCYEARILRGVADRALVIVSDVTEREALHSQLLVANQMAAIGSATSSVAHEIRSPLAAIKLNVDELQSCLGDDDIDVADLHDIVRDTLMGVDAVTSLVEELRQGARTCHQETTCFDMRSAIHRAVRLVRPLLNAANVVVDVDAPDACDVVANEVRLAQVVTNLLTNASHALSANDDNDRHVQLVVRHVGRDVTVDVKDNGPGIPADAQARVFERSYTTKPAEQGTGLGLAICRQLARSYDGELFVVDAEHGAHFRLVLPAAPPAL